MPLFFTIERIGAGFAGPPGDHGGTVMAADARICPGSLAGAAYLFVFMAQVLAIFWTQSRGPLLATLVGLYLFGLLLFGGLRPRGYRIWTASGVGMGLAGVDFFLALLNTTAVSAAVRSIPSVSRLSTLLDLESKNAQSGAVFPAGRRRAG